MTNPRTRTASQKRRFSILCTDQSGIPILKRGFLNKDDGTNSGNLLKDSEIFRSERKDSGVKTCEAGKAPAV